MLAHAAFVVALSDSDLSQCPQRRAKCLRRRAFFQRAPFLLKHDQFGVRLCSFARGAAADMRLLSAAVLLLLVASAGGRAGVDVDENVVVVDAHV